MHGPSAQNCCTFGHTFGSGSGLELEFGGVETGKNWGLERVGLQIRAGAVVGVGQS